MCVWMKPCVNWGALRLLTLLPLWLRLQVFLYNMDNGKKWPLCGALDDASAHCLVKVWMTITLLSLKSSGQSHMHIRLPYLTCLPPATQRCQCWWLDMRAAQSLCIRWSRLCGWNRPVTLPSALLSPPPSFWSAVRATVCVHAVVEGTVAF